MGVRRRLPGPRDPATPPGRAAVGVRRALRPVPAARRRARRPDAGPVPAGRLRAAVRAERAHALCRAADDADAAAAHGGVIIFGGRRRGRRRRRARRLPDGGDAAFLAASECYETCENTTQSERRFGPRKRQRVSTASMCSDGPAVVWSALGWESLGGRGATFRGADRAAEPGNDGC